jgi:5'-3' exonuclease
MCCIAGCDYVKKIRNIGLVTAHKFVNKYRTFTKTTDALLQSKYDGVDMQYVIQVRGVILYRCFFVLAVW